MFYNTFQKFFRYSVQSIYFVAIFVLYNYVIQHVMAYSQEEKRQILDKVYAAMCCGISVRAFLRENKLVDRATFKDWVKENEEERAQYARAQECYYEEIADETLDIADDSTFDTKIGNDGSESLNSEFVQRSKLRVGVRQWILERRDLRYGAKLDVTTNGKDIAQQVDPFEAMRKNNGIND